jgi:DUF1680 family protein
MKSATITALLLSFLAVFIPLPALSASPASSASRASGEAPPLAQLFDLSQVRLLDGPFKTAQETDAAYLLKLVPDRLLSWFRKESGLAPKGEVYGGWESAGVAGHTLGHYLSAISQMYAATGDPEMLRRANYIVAELDTCQKANGDGYVAAIPNGKTIFAQIKRGDIRTDDGLNGGWVPWYTLHKELAGLLDAYHFCHNAQALAVATRLADWIGDEISGLNHEQMQKMLTVEQGGIAEALANLYGITHQPRYLALAERFCDDRVFIPLSQGKDVLTGLHANTQIPKFIGYQRVYELTGDSTWHAASLNFWNAVSHNRSWVIGANSAHEYFFPPDRFEALMTDTVGPESCNSYNMLKLTEHIFEYQPDASVMDFYERALFNHILATIRPHQDGFVYYTSLSPGSYRTYSTDFNDFWCCVGTGMENHARYGKAIYAHEGNDKLLVNLFIASTLDWPEAGVRIEQQTAFPEQADSQLIFHLASPKTLEVDVRYPNWVSPGAMKISVNGEAQPIAAQPDQFAAIARQWKDGDIMKIETPMTLHTEMLPHSQDYVALLYGPIVLAGKLGAQGMKPDDFTSQFMELTHRIRPTDLPVIVRPISQITAHLKPVDGQPLTFASDDLLKPNDVELVPFYKLYNERYSVYWHLMTPAAWGVLLKAESARETERQHIIASTIDQVQPQDPQSEQAHHFEGEDTRNGVFARVGWRDAPADGWFSYTLNVAKNNAPTQLACEYWGSDGGARTFDIQIDGTTIATETLAAKRPGDFYYSTYPIPQALTADKQTVTVRFKAKSGSIAGGVFDCRTVKMDG